MRTDADGAKERDDIVRLVRRARACLLEPSIARKVELSRETHAWWFSAREHPPARDDDGDKDDAGAMDGGWWLGGREDPLPPPPLPSQHTYQHQ